jgi:peptide deformylase
VSILKVARVGHPVVRSLARPVDPAELQSRELQQLLDDMVETMHEYEGVGLAAPQVHVPLRLAVLEVPASDARGREAVPLTVIVNPRLTPGEGAPVHGWEGCLSIPEMRGIVPRAPRVAVAALDREGRPLALEAEGFHARVLQHECDHLDGNVYLDRMADMRSLCFLHEFERFVAAPGEDDDDEEADRG